MAGIRLDSGDLGALAKHARKMLDEAGFPEAKIAASSSLDEHKITELKQAGAPIDLWGVGTRLSTGQPDAALDGVYKLGAIRDAAGAWQSRLKLSDTPAKQTNPGIQQVRRFTRDDAPHLDVIFDQGAIGAQWQHAVADNDEKITLPPLAEAQDLLVPVIVDGEVVYQPPALAESRDFARTQFATFAQIKQYAVALEADLHREKRRVSEQNEHRYGKFNDFE